MAKQASKTSKSQSRAFQDAAREASCDDNEAAWEERLRKVAKAQSKPETKKPAK